MEELHVVEEVSSKLNLKVNDKAKWTSPNNVEVLKVFHQLFMGFECNWVFFFLNSYLKVHVYSILLLPM